jgi:Domain of unknown function (DUF4351)
MVRAPMRTPYDQFAKQMARTALEVHGNVESDAEVSSNTRRIDLWFLPLRARPHGAAGLGLFDRITEGATTLEFFHNTPSGDELTACLFKHGEFRQALLRQMLPPPLVRLWVISAGRPDGAIIGLGFRPMLDWPSGVYAAPPLLETRLVVVNELPAARDTLMLRLLGARRVLKQAIVELKALPDDAPEKALALPILVRLRLASATHTEQTPEDQEFLMDTQDIYEAWRSETIQEGVREGERYMLLRQIRRRFGTGVTGDIEQRVTAASPEQIELWADRVLSAPTLADLLAD